MKSVRKELLAMRDCGKLLERLEKYPEELAYIKKRIGADSNLFLAFRDNYFNIYYMGGSLARIGFGRDKKEYVYFEVHEKYINQSGNQYVRLTWKEHDEKYNMIKKNIESIASGKNVISNEDDEEEVNQDKKRRKKITREKICQQWIINENNKSDGEWYYIDMEYTMKDSRSGRFDMIAVKKNADKNGKYQVALVELKIGKDSYGSMDSARYKKLEEDYSYAPQISSIYNYQEENYVSFGSGLLGHLCDYMRFLYGNHYKMLKKEIVNQICALKKIGAINEDHILNKIDNVEELSDKPEVYFVSFSRVPERKEDPDVSIDIMKESFYKYMYLNEEECCGKDGKIMKSSKYSAEEILKKSEIKGLLNIKQEFLDTKNPKFELEIGKENYMFHCVFVDGKSVKAWDCLDEK